MSLLRTKSANFVRRLSHKLSQLGASNFVRSIGENLKKYIFFFEISPFADLDFENL